jgi:hypothetical protein
MIDLTNPPPLATQQPRSLGPGARIFEQSDAAAGVRSSGSNGLVASGLDPIEAEAQSDAARVLRRVRRFMIISSALTLAAIAAILSLVGFRLLKGSLSAPQPTDVVLTLPKGAKIIQTAAAGDRIVVTLEVGGAIELRTFDLHSLKPLGRLSFSADR